MPLAPIALFVYNRPEHTRRTVEALQRNRLADASDLYVFSDAPRNAGAIEAVAQVRGHVAELRGFRSVRVISREQNLGLAGSVIAGVSELCESSGSVIVIEDDIVTGPDFLGFLNEGLDRYRDVPRVFSVGGLSFDIEVGQDYAYDAYFSYRSASCGWATWADRWRRADWGMSDYPQFVRDRRLRCAFSRGGRDLPRMLDLQMGGHIDSWSIRWDYAHFQHDGLALLPVEPRLQHIGDDGSGVHVRRARRVAVPLRSFPTAPDFYRLPDVVAVEPVLAKQVRDRFRLPAWRRFARQVAEHLGIK